MSRLLAAALADAVVAPPGSKFSVLGGSIDSFHAQSLPAALRMALLIAVEIDAGHDVTTQIAVRCLNPDGVEFAHIETLNRAGEVLEPTTLWLGFDLPNFQILRTGLFTFELHCEESFIRLPLLVEVALNPPAPSPLAGSRLN